MGLQLDWQPGCYTGSSVTKRSRGSSSGLKSIRKDLSLHRVELRVNQYPALLCSVPVFADPMVFELARIAVRPESASRARRNALRAQDCAEHQRKVMADAGHALAGRARDREGCASIARILAGILAIGRMRESGRSRLC